MVAAGAIALSALSAKGIKIGTHIKSVHGICDRGFDNIEEDIAALSEMDFAVLDGEKGALMRAEIEKAGASGDSVGGVRRQQCTVCRLESENRGLIRSRVCFLTHCLEFLESKE